MLRQPLPVLNRESILEEEHMDKLEVEVDIIEEMSEKIVGTGMERISVLLN